MIAVPGLHHESVAARGSDQNLHGGSGRHSRGGRGSHDGCCSGSWGHL